VTILLPEGWHFVQASQKRHYFKGGRSLCGRFNNVGPTVSDTLSSSDAAHFYNCAPCERKLRTGSTRRRSIHGTRKGLI